MATSIVTPVVTPVSAPIASATNAILSQIPTVLAATQIVEAAAPNLSSASKLQTVLNAIQTGAKVGEVVPVGDVQAISGLVDLTVTILNSLGIFTHHTTPPGKV